MSMDQTGKMANDLHGNEPMAAMEQQGDDKIASKRENEELRAKTIQLEKELEMARKVELMIRQVEGRLGDIESCAREIQDRMPKLVMVVQQMQTLSMRESKSNHELQEARRALICAISELRNRGNSIGVKRMGELDIKPFLEAMKEKFNDVEAVVKALELCSLWQGYLVDPNWHPYKVVTVEGKGKGIIKDDDEKLNELKNEIGEGAYKAVVTALSELNEYNPSERRIVKEMWNYAEGRKATLAEGIQFLMERVQKRGTGMM